MVGYFKALSDETRLRIFSLLLRRELNVNEVISVLGMGQSRVSRHLKILADSGLVKFRRDGLWVFYSVVDQGPVTGFVSSIRPQIEGLETFSRDLARIVKVRKEAARQTSRFFDSVAADWSSLNREILGPVDFAAILHSAMPRCPVAVDLGCGPGDILPVMKRKADLVIGVDNSPKMLKTARERLEGRSGFDLRIGEMEHLPLRDGEADFVLMSLVLHHLASPPAGLVEANRILKAGKTALILDLAKHGDETLRKRYGDRWLGFEPDEVERWLAGAGFNVRKKERIELNRGLKADLFLAVKAKNVTRRAPTA